MPGAGRTCLVLPHLERETLSSLEEMWLSYELKLQVPNIALAFSDALFRVCRLRSVGWFRDVHRPR